MLNKDIKELQQAYSTILNEAIDPNSYSSAIAHGAVVAGAAAFAFWPKIREFFKPQEEKQIEKLMRGGNMKKIIDNFVKDPTNVDARKSLRNALESIETPSLSPNVINKIINKLASITPERI